MSVAELGSYLAECAPGADRWAGAWPLSELRKRALPLFLISLWSLFSKPFRIYYSLVRAPLTTEEKQDRDFLQP